MAVRKMMQYGKDHPDEEVVHRKHCAEHVNNWLDERPELRRQIALQNIAKVNERNLKMCDICGFYSRSHTWVLVYGDIHMDVTLDQFNPCLAVMAKPIEINQRQYDF